MRLGNVLLINTKYLYLSFHGNHIYILSVIQGKLVKRLFTQEEHQPCI